MSISNSEVDAFLMKAKMVVAKNLVDHEISASTNDVYIVWFAKILNTWKALVSTDVISGFYWEVTANLTKGELYLDRYEKQSNNALNYDTLETL